MFAMINCMVTLGLNLINGFTGQFSIGQAGFVAVGGYTSAAVTTLLLPSSVLVPALRPLVFLVSVLIGGIVAGIFGYLIGKPSLRLKGDYLAIVTLAFGEIIRSLIRLIPQVGGPRGFSGIPRYSNLLWIVLFFGGTIWVLRNYIYSSFGRACIACREDELAAGTMGVDTTKYKVMAFTIGSAIAVVAGGLLARSLGLTPSRPVQLPQVPSVFLVYLYAGGAGSMTGPSLGATLLTIFPKCCASSRMAPCHLRHRPGLLMLFGRRASTAARSFLSLSEEPALPKATKGGSEP
jgi:branched-chain amino acid transport system permease protein